LVSAPDQQARNNADPPHHIDSIARLLMNR